MDLVVQFIVAVFATIAFAVLFSVPKKELAFCGFTGALGWIIYSVCFFIIYRNLMSYDLCKDFRSHTGNSCNRISSYRNIPYSAGICYILYCVLSFHQ